MAALSVFTSSLSDAKKIEFLKLKDDEMFFTVMNDIIVAGILNVSTGGELKVIDSLLKFIGKKFLDRHFVDLGKPNFNWEEIAPSFTEEIQVTWTSDEVYEKTKRDLIGEFMARVLEGEMAPDLFQWKITSLFLESPPEKIELTIEKIGDLKKKLPTMVNTDPKLFSTIDIAFERIITELSKALPRNKTTLIVVTGNTDDFEVFSRKALAYQLFCKHVKEIVNIPPAMSELPKGMTSHIVIMSNEISAVDMEQLKTLPSSNSKIYLWMRSNSILSQIKGNTKFVYVPQNPSFKNLLTHFLEPNQV